jgi:hypothetical protein
MQKPLFTIQRMAYLVCAEFRTRMSQLERKMHRVKEARSERKGGKWGRRNEEDRGEGKIKI